MPIIYRRNSFSSSASFACPLSESDLKGFLGSSDLSSLGLGSLSGALSGLGSSSRFTKRQLSSLELEEEARNAIGKVFERGWEVLREQDLERRNAHALAAGGKNPKKNSDNKVFDSKRRYRIGTLGPLFPIPPPR
jgi:hypothetical protein